MRIFKVFKLMGLMSLMIVVNRCGSSPSTNSTTSSPSSFASIYSNSLQPQCNTCHSPGHTVYDNSKVLLDMSTQANAYASLAKNSTSPSAASCAGIPYAKAKDPANSYLTIVLAKVYNVTGAGGKAACVPYNAHLSANLLQQSEIDNITAWVNAGALNN